MGSDGVGWYMCGMWRGMWRGCRSGVATRVGSLLPAWTLCGRCVPALTSHLAGCDRQPGAEPMPTPTPKPGARPGCCRCRRCRCPKLPMHVGVGGLPARQSVSGKRETVACSLVPALQLHLSGPRKSTAGTAGGGKGSRCRCRRRREGTAPPPLTWLPFVSALPTSAFVGWANRLGRWSDLVRQQPRQCSTAVTAVGCRSGGGDSHQDARGMGGRGERERERERKREKTEGRTQEECS